MKYPLSCDTWNNQEVDAINRVISSSRYTMGEEVFKFEEQFADFMGVNHAKMVNSGSSANLLMIAAAIYSPEYNLKEGDKVIVPAVSWSTTYFPLQQYGLELVFVDVDLHTLNLCPTKTAEALENIDGIKAILTVNLLGNPSQIDELRDLADSYNLLLLEDNCESFGSSFNEKMMGTYGDMGTHSFFFSHHLQTMEGGMILTNSEQTAQYIDSLRAHGWLRTLPDENYIHNKTGDPFEDSFRFVLPGYSVRPLEMSGAIGQVQLSKWPDMMKQRRENAKHFKKRFEDIAVITQEEIGKSSWFGFSCIVPDVPGRQKFTDTLRDRGVEIRPIVAGNFLRNPVMKHIKHQVSGDMKNADIIHDLGFFLGNDSEDIKDKIDYAADIIEEILWTYMVDGND